MTLYHSFFWDDRLYLPFECGKKKIEISSFPACKDLIYSVNIVTVSETAVDRLNIYWLNTRGSLLEILNTRQLRQNIIPYMDMAWSNMVKCWLKRMADHLFTSLAPSLCDQNQDLLLEIVWSGLEYDQNALNVTKTLGFLLPSKQTELCVTLS